MHDADRELPDAARQLPGAEDRRLRGIRGVDVVAARQDAGALRCAADAARIEQRARAVPAVGVEAEGAGSLDEERPALVEEGLERREVDDGRIRFDLAEVGVERRGERE